jgi:hypothetical protein
MFASVLLATNCTRSLSRNKTTRVKRGKALWPLEKPYFHRNPSVKRRFKGDYMGNNKMHLSQQRRARLSCAMA